MLRYRCIFFACSFTLLFWSCKAPIQKHPKPREYEVQRALLVQSDLSQKFSADLVLTPVEKELNVKLVALREEMKSQYDSLGFFPPAQPFVKYKNHVSRTPLFKLLQKMPKGGIHHLHPSAGADFNWLINEVIKYPEAYIFWEEDSNDYIKGQIEFFGLDEVPAGFKAAAELAKQHRDFKNELLGFLTFSQEPARDSLDIWVEFEKVFQRIGGAYDYKPLFENYIENVAQNLIDDNIMHMETRMFLSSKYQIDAANQRHTYPVDTTIQILKRVAQKIQKKHPGFTHKAIYTSLRFLPKEQISKELINAFKLRKEYPEFIKGFDLVAEEDNGYPTHYFQDSWEMMDSLQGVYGIDMPLYLHNGESNSQSITNLYDTALLGSKRIGHGFNLMHFPKVIELVKQHAICIEVSPLSNQLLGYVKDLRLHPASIMLRHGVQCSINSDDPAIFGYTGLSYDYWYSIMAWELDLKDVKKLVFNSITYSALDAQEKKEALKALSKSWDHFVSQSNAAL